MGTATVIENATELKLPFGSYSTVTFDLIAEVKRGNLGSQIQVATTAYGGTVFNAGSQPTFFTITNPIVDDGIVNTGSRAFEVLLTGTVNGAAFSDTITVTVEDDEAGKPVLLGTGGRDVDLGTTSAEYIQALGGNDHIRASIGDTVDGGPGRDTVQPWGTGWFNPIKTESGWALNNSQGGQATLIDVERVQMSTSTIYALDIDGNAGTIYRIYQAAFARTPDKAGISYWINQLDNGLTLRDVAYGFVESQEFKTAYGSNPTNIQLVEKLYQNVLGRPAEKAGVDYWVGLLEQGTSVLDVVAAISESTENKTKVAGAIGVTGIELDGSYFLF